MRIFKLRKSLICSLRKNHLSDICIVGGGSVGMITALMLAKHNYKVTVLEKDKAISSKN